MSPSLQVRTIRAAWLFAAAALLAVCLAGPRTAVADPLVVDTTEDSDDDNDASGNSPVTLRKAIAYATAKPNVKNGGVPHRITFADSIFSGGRACIKLNRSLNIPAKSDLTPLNPLIIEGPDDGRELTLDGQGRDRVFCQSAFGACCDFSNLKIVNGSAAYGGGVYLEQGTNTFTGVTFENCAATSKNGGAIWIADGQLTLRNCRFAGNSASGDGGAIYINRVAKRIVVERTTFIGNAALAAGRGGAVFHHLNDIAFVDCSFLDNSAWNGGAAYFTEQTTGALFVNCTLRGNSSLSAGGALYVTKPLAKVAFINTLAVGNKSTSSACHDWDCVCFGAAGGVNAYGSIFGSGLGTNGNLVASTDGRVWTDVDESAVFEHRGSQRVVETVRVGAVLQSYERIRGRALTGGVPVKHDDGWVNVSCTVSGSARGAGSDATKAKTALTTDITARDLSGETPQVGSFWMIKDKPSLVVDTLDDVCDPFDMRNSLREVVSNLTFGVAGWTDLASGGKYAISFKNGLSGVIGLSTSQFDIRNLAGTPVEITGSSAPVTFDGGGRHRAFRVRAGNELRLSNLSFTNCLGSAYGYAPQPGNHGGAILNEGHLQVANCAFWCCSAGPKTNAPSGYGGALATVAGGTTAVSRVTFCGNAAARGGAVYTADRASTGIDATTFDSNRSGGPSVSTSAGAAVASDGSSSRTVLTHCSFARNVAAGNAPKGGAVYAQSGLVLVDDIFAWNVAGDSADDLFVTDPAGLRMFCTVTNASDTVLGNRYPFKDGGVGQFCLPPITGWAYAMTNVWADAYFENVWIGADARETAVVGNVSTGLSQLLRDQRNDSRPTPYAGAVREFFPNYGPPQPPASPLTWQDQVDRASSDDVLVMTGQPSVVSIPFDKKRLTLRLGVVDASSWPDKVIVRDASQSVVLEGWRVINGVVTNVFTAAGCLFVGPQTRVAAAQVYNCTFAAASAGPATTAYDSLFAMGSAAPKTGVGNVVTCEDVFVAPEDYRLKPALARTAPYDVTDGTRAAMVLGMGWRGPDGRTLAESYEIAGSTRHQMTVGCYRAGVSVSIPATGAMTSCGSMSAALLAANSMVKTAPWFSVVEDGIGYALMLNELAIPTVEAISVSSEGVVTVTPGNVKSDLTYGLSWAEALDGEFVVDAGSWKTADAIGHLPGPLVCSGKGTAGFCKVVVRER